MTHTRRALGSIACAATVAGLLLPTGAAVGATTCTFSSNPNTRTLGLKGDCDLTSTQPIPDGWTLDGNQHKISVDGTGFAGPIIESAAGSTGGAPATMRVIHLTIAASNFGQSTGRPVGILFDGAKGLVSDVHISGVSAGAGSGIGIEVANSAGATFQKSDRVNIRKGTTISGYGRAGVYVHDGTRFSFFRSKILASAAISGARNVDGIIVADRAHGSIKESRITESDSNPASSSAFGSGVRISSTRRVEIKRNVFSGPDADFGISISNSQGTHTTAAIDCNLFRRKDTSSSDPYGVGVGRWTDGPAKVLVTNSTFWGWKHATGTVSGTSVTAGAKNVRNGNCPPSKPTHVKARGGNRATRVVWHPGANQPHYAPVTSYRVTAKTSGLPAITKHVAGTHTSAWLTGLRNRRTYVVTVTARSNGGHASASSRLFPTKMRLSAKPKAVHRGHRAVLHGRLVSAAPKAHLAKRKVTIMAKAKGHHWKKLATVRTKATGAFSYLVRPHRKTTYKAVYAGHPDLASHHRTVVRVRR
jgi:hypothetical protein